MTASALPQHQSPQLLRRTGSPFRPEVPGHRVSPRSGVSRGVVGSVILCFASLSLLMGCSQFPESEYPSSPPEGISPEEEPVLPAPPGAIWRKDVTETLDAGLGYFLQRIEVEAELVEDSFVGFRVMALRPQAWWQGIDLAPGDIVTQVNSMPIEQPAEAHAAFESLRTASEVTISYLRNGQARQLRYQILDAPLASSSTQAAGKAL